jgi:hypothetical protein
VRGEDLERQLSSLPAVSISHRSRSAVVPTFVISLPVINVIGGDVAALSKLVCFAPGLSI